MIVKTFKPQFAPMVRDGSKAQTVRPKGKRTPKPGDVISLRMWTGKPYRSKQEVLRESIVMRVEEITVCAEGIWTRVAGGRVWHNDVDGFARDDGFADFAGMREWFVKQHGLPFEGIVIYWAKPAVLETLGRLYYYAVIEKAYASHAKADNYARLRALVDAGLAFVSGGELIGLTYFHATTRGISAIAELGAPAVPKRGRKAK